MIDLRELNETIDDIKRKGGTVNDAIKLAMLYIAKDHMQRDEESAQREYDHHYSQTAAPKPVFIEIEPRSEFLEACDGARIEDVLVILDEHMEAIMVLYPKEYNALVEKIRKTQYR